MCFLSHAVVMEQQAGVRRKLIEEADKRFRVWKLLGKRVCGAASLWAKVLERDFQPSVHSGERSRESPKRRPPHPCLPRVAAFGNIWVIVGVYLPP